MSNPGSKEVEPALKACPFCPHPTERYYAVRDVGWLHDRETTRRVVAVCSQCGAQGPAFGVMSFNNKETASQYWNRRAAIPMPLPPAPLVSDNDPDG